MKKTLFITLLVILIVGCTCQLPHYLPTPRPEETNEDEDYAVLGALLQYVASEASQYVLVDTSTTGFGFDNSSSDQFDYLSEQLPQLTRDMIDNWQAANTDAITWENEFDLGVPVVFISQDELDKLQDDVYWTGFHTQYPEVGGYFEISRPGFNETGDQALVYLSFFAGSLAAHGTFYLLSYENGVWQVVGEAMIWIS
ncbi:MAG TPA: hypothetical protein VN376_01725 [Longilinea sp.]|nr:hypothetical protein [Longilinea sp.]